jgi:sporulation protein YlmC with PRC-barrel domain
MKTHWLWTMFSGLAISLAAFAVMAEPPQSGDIPPGEQATPPVEDEVDVADEAQTEEQAAKEPSRIACRASDLIGMSVKNKDGEALGSLKDLVFDPKTGTICYAALARGGLLGIGEKLVAVPWEAFECQVKEHEQRAFRPDEQPETAVVSQGRFELILDMDAETLDQHPGFDKNTWPASGDESLMEEETQPVEEPVEESPPVELPESPADTLPEKPLG